MNDIVLKCMTTAEMCKHDPVVYEMDKKMEPIGVKKQEELPCAWFAQDLRYNESSMDILCKEEPKPTTGSIEIKLQNHENNFTVCRFHVS